MVAGFSADGFTDSVLIRLSGDSFPMLEPVCMGVDVLLICISICPHSRMNTWVERNGIKDRKKIFQQSFIPPERVVRIIWIDSGALYNTWRNIHFL